MDQQLPIRDPKTSASPEPPALEKEPALSPAPEFSGGADARRPSEASVVKRWSHDHLHLREYLRVLYKRRHIAAAAFLIAFGSVAAYTFTATPIYSATAQLLIENEESNVVDFKEVVKENRQTVDYYQTQYRILSSRALARRTLDAEKLWNHPMFTARRPSLVATVKGWFGLGKQAIAEPKGAAETQEQSDVIDTYLNALRISPVRNSRLVQVTFLTPDAALSARIANAHAAAYIDQNLEFKFLASKEAADWLSDRMKEQRQQVEQSEQALQKYREQTGAVALEDRQNIVVQRLADLNTAVTKARTERIEKEAVYNQLKEIQTDKNALDTYPAILNNTFVQQLKAQLSELQRQQAQLADKLGERHPDMVKVRSAIDSIQTRINAEVQKVVQSTRNDYQAALANERSLQQSLDQQREEAQQLNRASIQYGALQRDAQSNKEIFSGLLQRTRQTDIATDLKTNNIRVVDAAETPRSPSSPNRRNNLIFGVVGGLFLGICLGFLTEYFDNRIKSPDEIPQHLGVSFLGLIPKIAPSVGNIDTPLISRQVPHAFSEAVRTIRTNVVFSTAEEGPKTLVVTSTGPGEGKTVVTANLAIALAQAGNRVVILDCDMRKPRVHELFGVSREPGLSNVMVGSAKASDAVRRSLVTNLWCLPAGKLPPNPAELLGSKRFREFVTSLGEHFDWIILDSPPVMAVTDATILAHFATGVVFVIGCEMTARGTARTAIAHLDSAQAKYFGAVLNLVDLNRNPYYYANYYRSDYANYYQREGSNQKDS